MGSSGYAADGAADGVRVARVASDQAGPRAIRILRSETEELGRCGADCVAWQGEGEACMLLSKGARRGPAAREPPPLLAEDTLMPDTRGWAIG